MVATTKAVRVACDGERATIEPLQTYNVAYDHEIFAKGNVSTIMKGVDFPLLVMKVYPSLKVPKMPRRQLDPRERAPAPMYGYTEGGDYFPNKAAFLLMSDDRTWYDKVGSILVARQDGKPLLPKQLEIILKFLDEILLGQNGETVTEQERIEMLQFDILKMYYEAQAASMGYSDIPSPFEEEVTPAITSEDVKMEEAVAW